MKTKLHTHTSAPEKKHHTLWKMNSMQLVFELNKVFSSMTCTTLEYSPGGAFLAEANRAYKYLQQEPLRFVNTVIS